VTIWYYFNTERRVEGEKWTEGQPVDKSSERLREIMLAQKVILVECNESAAESFGMGFLEPALKAIGIEPVSTPPPDFLARVQDRILASRR